MFNSCRKIFYVAGLALALAGQYTPGNAQNVRGLNENSVSGGTTQPALPPSEGASQFLIEPEAQIKGDTIKQKTYRSDPAGQNQNWNLDIGRFQGDYNEDPKSALDAPDNDTFSGVRLRLPFRGGTEQ